MITSGINKLATILTTIIIAVIVFSCKDKVVNEVKVPDFTTLRSQFTEPPREYTTSPFFVWNAKITKEEIDYHLTGFKDAGSSCCNSSR